jgi:hypothetical protein
MVTNLEKKEESENAPLLRILRSRHSHIHVHHANERKWEKKNNSFYLRVFAFICGHMLLQQYFDLRRALWQ